MTAKVIIRCEKCGKVLKGKTDKGQLFGECPRCNEKFSIPDPVTKEDRKHSRIFVSESPFAQNVPDSLSKTNENPLYRVSYTKAPPVVFTLKRLNQSPLLDLSEGGMCFLIKAESKEVLPGDTFVIEVDFPILDQPFYINVKVCWISPINEEMLLKVGVQFLDIDQTLLELIKNLIDYIDSRNETPDIDIWASFG